MSRGLGMAGSRCWWRSIAALVLGLWMTLPAPAADAQQPVAQRIAAIVNKEIISNRELTARISLAIVASGLPDDTETRRRITPQVLRGVIDERLQLQAADRLSLGVTDAELDRTYAEVAQRNKMAPAQLSEYLTSHGIDPSVVREQLRAQLAWFKVIGRELRSRVVVTEDQVDFALKAARLSDEEVLLSEILLPVYDTDSEQNVMAQAGNLAHSIRSGGDFAGLARQLSAAPSKDTGGDLGWVRLSAIMPELRPMVASLKPGEVSEPVRTQAGVQLVQMRERRAVTQSASTPSHADRDRMRTQLQEEQLQRLAARYLRDLRRNAFIDVRL